MSDNQKNTIIIYNARNLKTIGDFKNSLAVKINTHDPILSTSVDADHKSATWNKEVILMPTETKVSVSISYYREHDEKVIATLQLHLYHSISEIVKWYPLPEGGELLIGSKIPLSAPPKSPRNPNHYPSPVKLPHNYPPSHNIPMGIPQQQNIPIGIPHNVPMGASQNIPMGMPQNIHLGVPLGQPFSHMGQHPYYPQAHKSFQLDIEKILPQNVSSQLVAYEVKDIVKEPKPFAKGSYGVIYKGNVKGIDKPVVIKEMEIRDAKSLEDWKREISLMVMYRSPFIVETFGYNFNGGTLSIIMEYMSKGDLYNIIHTSPQKHSISRIMRFRMARHIALGIAHLHKFNIMHRDIKSMNVLVSEDYSCKLSDFGTAKILNSSTIQYLTYTMNAGTPLWMAPEVKMGSNYNLSADIYSLGLVYFELFEKKLPLWDGVRQCVQLPPAYQSSFIVNPLININPQLRLNANQVVDMLDSIIFNLINNVKKFVSADHYELKEDFKSTEEKETAESRQLYKYLIGLPKEEVDSLLIKESALPNSYLKVNPLRGSDNPAGSKSQNAGNIPIGQPSHMPYPPGYPPGFQTPGMSQMYPPGFPPGYHSPSPPPPGY